jgi:copper(I)-binding protein
MRRSIARVILVSMIVVGCGSADDVAELQITNAWARPTPAESSLAAVYLSVTSPVADELIAVSTLRSKSASLHLSSRPDSGGGHHHGGSASETTMTDTELFLEPDSTVELAPGGLHVMLEGLGSPLIEGDSFELILTFREAGERTVIVDVSTNEPAD